MSDDITNPPHYTQGSIECIEAIKTALTPEEFRGHCKANAIKYIWRMNLKGQEQDNIRKAIRYLEMLLEEKGKTEYMCINSPENSKPKWTRLDDSPYDDMPMGGK